MSLPSGREPRHVFILDVLLKFFFAKYSAMPVCKKTFPKCHSTVAGCRCPNPWLEYLAKAAAERKQQGKPGLSLKAYATAYRSARDAGQFKVPAALEKKNSPCKSDAYKLCSMLLRRNTKADYLSAIHRAENVRADKAVKSHLQGYIRYHRPGLPKIEDSKAKDVFQQFFDVDDAAAQKTGVIASFLQLFRPPKKARQLDDLALYQVFDLIADRLSAVKVGLKIGFVVSQGSFGAVFRGEYNGRLCAVKVIRLDTADEDKAFEREVYMMRKARQVLPANVPEVYDAYKCGKNGKTGVIIMEFVYMPLQMFLLRAKLSCPDSDDPAAKNDEACKKLPSLLRSLARNVKRLLARLHAAGIVHGDCHESNIAYTLVNGAPRLYLIDFGLSFEGESDGIDEFFVWRASLEYQTTIDAFRAVGFAGSRFLTKHIGSDKPAVDQDTDKGLAEKFDEAFVDVEEYRDALIAKHKVPAGLVRTV